MNQLAMRLEVYSHSSTVNALAFHPQGRFLASGGEPEPSICLWDGTTFTAQTILRGHEDRILTLGWSADGRRIGSFSDDHTMRLWDPVTGHAVAAVTPHTSIQWLMFSPQYPVMATGHTDGRIGIWDAETGDRIRTMQADTMPIQALAWSPDSAFLLSGSRDGMVRIWDWKTGIDHGRIVLNGVIHGLAWSAHHSLIAIGNDETLYLWDLRQRTTVRQFTLDDWISAVAWSPDGTVIAAAGFRDDRAVRGWDGTTGDLCWEVDDWNDFVTALAFHPTQSVLAVGSGGRWGGYIEIYPLHRPPMDPSKVESPTGG